MNKDKFNVLLIVTDEQRITELGAYGSTSCKTPNLDKLAKQSVVYENAYTSCPLCSPARATIQTGLYPHSHGTTCNTSDIGCNAPELNDTPFLLPRVMMRNGYSCGFNGKWHLGTSNGNAFGSGREAALPSHFGYEGMDFPGHGGIGMNYPQYKKYLKDNSYTIDLDVKEDMAPLLYGSWKEGEEVGVPHFITDFTISLMEDFRKRNKHFFMLHNFWGPHQPYYVPEKYLRMYDGVSIPEWENFNWKPANKDGSHRLRALPQACRNDWKAWENLIKHKYAFVTYIDNQIGRMLDYLEEAGLSENTMIIFTADHGDNLGGHGGLIDKGFVHFEDTHRIPLLIKHPQRRHEIRKEFASLVDIYPTVLDAAGAGCHDKIHGHSLLDETASPRDCIVTEFHGLNNITLSMRTIRSKNIKYGWSCCGGDKLYDLEKDPFETRNAIEDPAYGQELKNLKIMLGDWMRKHDDHIVSQYERYI